MAIVVLSKQFPALGIPVLAGLKVDSAQDKQNRRLLRYCDVSRRINAEKEMDLFPVCLT